METKHTPRGYSRSVAVVSAIAWMGAVLQLMFGDIEYSFLRWPVSGLAGGIIILSVAAFSVYRGSRFFRWFSGVRFNVTLIAALTVMGIVMGLIPQAGAAEIPGLPARFGLLSVTRSWPFALIYVTLLLSLGTVVVRRAAGFRWRDYAFYLNHCGLWLLLFSAGLGAADLRRYKMVVPVGGVERRAQGTGGETVELPVAVRLNSLDIEEYPPALAVLDRASGTLIPATHPDYMQLGDTGRAIIGGRDISVTGYIHHAVPDGRGGYREAVMPASAPAAEVTVRDAATGAVVAGWVSYGSAAQPAASLDIEGGHSVVMTRPEPRRFASDIAAFTPDGRRVVGVLEVNRPMRLGHWRFYQYGYDTDAGRMSQYSVIELVYDPWALPVYVGIALLGAGAVSMLWSGRRGKSCRNNGKHTAHRRLDDGPQECK